MRLLMLYGVNCNKTVWDSMKPFLQQHDIDYVEYPHEIIGHSLGGIIALQLATEYKMRPKKIVYLDTNLKPAKAFYRNLMTSEHMEQFGESVIHMFQEELEFYTVELFDSLQKEFDYSGYVNQLGQKVYAVYGDRNQPEYSDKIKDLNLSSEISSQLEFRFVHNACHMIMLENPEGLGEVLAEIFTGL